MHSLLDGLLGVRVWDIQTHRETKITFTVFTVRIGFDFLTEAATQIYLIQVLSMKSNTDYKSNLLS